MKQNLKGRKTVIKQLPMAVFIFKVVGRYIPQLINMIFIRPDGKVNGSAVMRKNHRVQSTFETSPEGGIKRSTKRNGLAGAPTVFIFVPCS